MVFRPKFPSDFNLNHGIAPIHKLAIIDGRLQWVFTCAGWRMKSNGEEDYGIFLFKWDAINPAQYINTEMIPNGRGGISYDFDRLSVMSTHELGGKTDRNHPRAEIVFMYPDGGGMPEDLGRNDTRA